MLENAVFFVASREACAAISWKTSQAAPKAAEKLRITATELCKLKIADGIIPFMIEFLSGTSGWCTYGSCLDFPADKAGGHQGHEGTCTNGFRYLTLSAAYEVPNPWCGGFVEGEEVDPEKKRNMKRKEADLSQITADIEVEIENLKKVVQDAKGKTPVPTISDEAVEKLKEEVDKEMTNAFISMGLQEKLEALKMELSKSPNASDQALNQVLKEKVDGLVQEFNHNLSRPGSFMSLKQKLLMLSKVTKLNEKLLRGEKLRKELNEKLRAHVKDQIEILRNAREKVAKGEKLEEQVMKEVEKAKEVIQNMLKSVNLEVVGLGRKAHTAPPGLEDKLKKADDVITAR